MVPGGLWPHVRLNYDRRVSRREWGISGRVLAVSFEGSGCPEEAGVSEGTKGCRGCPQGGDGRGVCPEDRGSRHLATILQKPRICDTDVIYIAIIRANHFPSIQPCCSRQEDHRTDRNLPSPKTWPTLSRTRYCIQVLMINPRVEWNTSSSTTDDVPHLIVVGLLASLPFFLVRSWFNICRQAGSTRLLKFSLSFISL